MFKHQKAPEQPRRQVKSQHTQPAFMYRALRSSDDSPIGRNINPIEKKKTDSRSRKLAEYWLHRAGFIIGTIAIVICLVELIRVTPDVQVVALNKESQPYLLHTRETYQQAASKLFSGSLDNSNKITINTADIAQKLEAEFPELSNVSVTLPLIGHTPVLYMQVNEPAFILVESGQQLVVAQDGRVDTTEAKTADVAGLNLPVVTDGNNVSVPTQGNIAMASSDVSFINVVLFELKHGGIAASGLNIPSGSRELDVHIKGEPFFVKFNLATGDAKQQAGTFLAAWQFLKQQGQTPSQYIDVRVDGGAYYK